MNENVRMPIETVREGNKITKTCVEDVYKIVNRVLQSMDKSYNNSLDILNDLQDDNYGDDSAIVFGRGVSQPYLTDVFDEKIGNNIAFMKMRLNANIKKHNFLVKIWNNYVSLLGTLDKEIEYIDENIKRDLSGVRNYNSEYLQGIESKLGI